MQTELYRAQKLIHAHKYDQALVLLLPLFVKNNDARISYLIGKSFLEKGDISNAVRFLERASQQGSADFNILLELGKAYQAFDMPHLAREIYRTILPRGQSTQALQRENKSQLTYR